MLGNASQVRWVCHMHVQTAFAGAECHWKRHALPQRNSAAEVELTSRNGANETRTLNTFDRTAISPSPSNT